MFCPECEGEFVEGIYRCPDCEIDLVPELQAKEPPDRPPELELVTVVRSGDPTLISIAKDVLEGAGIACADKGAGLQSLFALGKVGMGFNPLTGPIELQVAQPDLERAREVLDSLESAALEPVEPADGQ